MNWNQVMFGPRHWNQANIDHPDKTKSISMITLIPSDLLPVSKNRVNFDHYQLHKNQVNRSSHSKQANFGPYTVNFDPAHKKHFTFDPKTKSRWNSIPQTKINLISTPILKIMSNWSPLSNHVKSISTVKSRQLRCLHAKQSFCCMSFELSCCYYSLRRWGGGSTGVIQEPRHRPLLLVSYRTARIRELPPPADWSGH